MKTTQLHDEKRRLTVDHALCSGTGRCQEIAPDVFRVESRMAWPADGPDLAAADPEHMAEAESSCPWPAITFERGEPT
ncbi:ferredoxin [Streptomyces sp. NPDC047515]|uniref:ferredoxin n=1 Tax=Streptomyces sp. NPDC047515 TaxID=3155380 RepID=UPI0033CB9878